MCLVGGLAGFALYAKRRARPSCPEAEGARQVINSTRLGPSDGRRHRGDGRRLLLGVTEHSVKRLAWARPAELLPSPDADLPTSIANFCRKPPSSTSRVPVRRFRLDDDNRAADASPPRDSDRMREAATRAKSRAPGHARARPPLVWAIARPPRRPQAAYARAKSASVAVSQPKPESPAIPNAPLDRMADELRGRRSSCPVALSNASKLRVEAKRPACCAQAWLETMNAAVEILGKDGLYLLQDPVVLTLVGSCRLCPRDHLVRAHRGGALVRASRRRLAVNAAEPGADGSRAISHTRFRCRR